MKAKIEQVIFFLNRVDRGISSLEGGLVVIIMIAMFIIGILQVIVRKFFSTGLTFADPFLRQMVPWVGLLGAAIASQENRHIGIDAVTRLLPPIGKLFARLAIGILILYVATIFIQASISHLANEASLTHYGERLFGLPIWAFQVIFPIAFAMICFHHAVKIVVDLLGFFIGRYDLVQRVDEADGVVTTREPAEEGKV